VKIGARGTTVPVGSYYGYPTGIVGLRLFPNPDFDAAAAKRWDPKRFYEDPSYYNDKNLVRPYRIGMSCAFCHVGPNPIKPPDDPENPKWENLSSNVGAQYFWVDRILMWNPDASSFPYQLFHTSRPGTLDTSLISTDNINNARWGKSQQQAVQRFFPGRRTDEILPASEYGLDAARPQGRLRFSRRSRRIESRLSQHWAFQRRVAAALPRPRRRPADFADRDLCRAQEFRVLGSDGTTNARHGLVFSEEHRCASFERCAGWRGLPHKRSERAPTRSNGLRRSLCTVPLQQDSYACSGC
jgi:hypothetical protein